MKAKRIILFFLLLSALIPIPLVEADPDWLTGWQYRKSHTITGSTEGARTDYQVGIKVYYGSGADGTEIVDGIVFGKIYTESKCKTDFGDINFTATDKTTLLDFFIESQVDSDHAIIWVKVDAIPISPDTDIIYMYYGNAGASTTSNGDNTFPWLFDDFDDYSINDTPNVVDWLTSGTDANNIIKVVADPDDAGKKCFTVIEAGEGTPTNLEGLLKDYRTGVAFRFKMRSTDNIWYMGWREDAGLRVSIMRADDDDHMEWYNGVSYQQFNPVEIFTANTWYLIENQIMDTGKDYFHWLQDGTDNTGGFRTTPIEGVNINYLNPYRFEAQTIWMGGVGTDGRYIHARNFIDPEPTHTAWGSEETQILFAPTKLFGAGFNASAPYVILRWASNLTDINFFEIQNSTDKISWDYLGQSTTNQYTDLQVTNGLERFYRIRACNYTESFWVNSTFTDINFEKVYFVSGGGGLFPGLAIGISLLIIGAIYALEKRR